MSALLPKLDDRRWTDLVEEGRALIPVYSPEWTDHNVHDPGITVLELLAWLAETDIFRVDRVPDRNRRKFLSLVGIRPAPPRAARAVLRIGISAGNPIVLPAGVEFTTRSARAVPFRSIEALTLVPGKIDAVQWEDASGFHDVTQAWLNGEAFLPFGPAPEPGAVFYVGLTDPLPVGVPATLFFSLAGGRTGLEERARFGEEEQMRESECRPPENPCSRSRVTPVSISDEDKRVVLRHHAVRTVWEFASAADGRWVPLDPARGEVEDSTRALTLDGAVRLRLPEPMESMKRGEVGRSLAYLRLRFAAGAHDAAPKVLDVSLNGVPAEQSVSATLALPIRVGADIPTSPLKPGDRVPLRIQLDEHGRIEKLRQEGEPDDPRFLVLDYRPPAASAEGVLPLEALWLGRGNGLPRQSLELPGAPVEVETLALFSFEGESGWWKWEDQPDLDASGPTARHFVLDAQQGVAAFGDGERGLVPSEGSLLFASYSMTQVESGNVGSGAIEKVDDSLHNRTIPNWTELKAAIASVTNPQAANGGASAEAVPHAAGRAVEMMETPVRAVTASDYERLASETPGVRLARVTAKANLHPALPCSRAPGVVTVIVLPELPRGKPSPSAGLKRAVKSFLERRRVVGTRVEVVGPTYTTVTIRARVAPEPGASAAALRSRIVEALGLYFDPLRGGADGKGWPFGRDVYRAEILGVIDAVPGVDHVLSLDLFSGSCEPECGSVCVGAVGLVASGSHEIEVLSERGAP